MKNIVPIILCLVLSSVTNAQDLDEQPKFYIGVSYGPSIAVGDFEDKNVDNSDAGFAENGHKLDIFGGYFITKNITITGIFRYQSFDTDISNIIEDFNAQNPEDDLTAASEEWRTYALFAGIAYEVKLTRNFSLFPRLGLGPLLVTNPSVSAIISRGEEASNVDRGSETDIGLGYEVGVGLRKNLGRRFALTPMLTFSGGVVSIANVETGTNGVVETRNYRPKIQSINFGLAVGYKFY
jgi:hypothetical protein